MNANKLKGVIVERGLTQQDVAKMIGITPKTFYQKMKSGNFGLDEVEIMIAGLSINNPAEIFLSNE